MPRIKVAKEDRKLITPEVMDGMINSASTRQDKALLTFYYIFGTRVSEPFSMKKSDIWIEGEWLYARIPRSKSKGTFPKIDTLKVKTGTDFIHYLIAHWAEIPNPEIRLFDYGHNKNTFRNKAWRLVKSVNKDAWPHIFRHTRNDAFRKKGYTTTQRMAWFGWIDPKTADKSYSHPSDLEIEKMGGDIE
jgi:integrase